jgi:hypothetical protein
LEPDDLSSRKGTQDNHDGKEITIALDDDLDRYLNFLKMMKLVRYREEAALAALRIYKKLNMHDWIPYVYRNGSERVLIIDQSLLNDLFNSISYNGLRDAARTSALKRKTLNPIDPELDLREIDNWDIILNELENYGWGKFTREGDEIMVEYLAVPIAYLKAYLETFFNVEFEIHQSKSGEIYVLSKIRDISQTWL